MLNNGRYTLFIQ
jgi:hypothetical protein